MEVFEIHLEVGYCGGAKRYFISQPTFAATGWEAAEKCREFLIVKQGVKSVELKYWRVLNPFKAHFLKFIPIAKHR